MVTEHSECLAAVHVLDETFAGRVNPSELEQFVTTHYTRDAQVPPPTVPLVRGQGQNHELYHELLEGEAGELIREMNDLHVVGDLG